MNQIPSVMKGVHLIAHGDLTLFGCTVLAPEVFPILVKRIEARQHVGKLVIDVAGSEL
jgi:hypothetical protein